MNVQKAKALSSIDSAASRLCRLSDDIWNHPETAYTEVESARFQIEALREFGFEVTENLAGISTAFSGRFGSGHPVIGILGEFDALSSLSQQADSTEKKPVVENAPGHGCGHNLLGTGSIAAALAVKQYLQQTGHSGTVVYFGCPAEEGGSGKAFMARDGIFDELDFALSWHPGDFNATSLGSSLANVQIRYYFTGISAHAAGCPELGRSALDAVELMNVGVQFLREHMISEARIHYAITDTGGFSPNVVQPRAEVLYLIRAPKNDQVLDLLARVNDIARGAALMTGTKVDIQFVKACSNIVPNRVLSEKLHENLCEVALPAYTEQEQAYAAAIAETYAGLVGNSLQGLIATLPADKAAEVKKHFGKVINDFVLPMSLVESTMPGSSDVGDVSWVCPTAQISAVTMAANTPGHSWQLVSQGKSSLAHKGMLYAGKVIAGAAIDILECPDALQAAKAEHLERLEHKPFVSPIPKDVRPQKLI